MLTRNPEYATGTGIWNPESGEQNGKDQRKKYGLKGVVPENNYTFKCCNEGFCNGLKSCQNAQNNILEVLKI